MQDKSTVFFTHGNGFPNEVYQELFVHLRPNYQVQYLDMMGHNTQFPVTENWHHLVAELIEAIEALTDTPLIGLGHSFGGVLTLLAAIERPELFKAVIMLDSPILTPFKSMMLRFIKQLGFIDSVTPAKKALKRRVMWLNKGEAFKYFRHKKLFAKVTDKCLNDYVTYGLVDDAEGVKLRFDPLIEYQIFRTLPHHLPDVIKTVPVPTGLIFGSETNVVTKTDINFMRHHYKILCEKIEGTHMFPLENPSLTANTIINLASKLTGS